MVTADYWQSITQWHAAGDLARAEAAYRAILDTEPGHSEAAHMLGMLLHQRGRDTESLNWLKQAIDQAGAHPVLLVNTARVHFDREDFDAALKLLDRALESRPSDAATHLLRFHCLFALGQPRPAMEAYRSASSLGGIDNPTRFRAARACQQMGAWVDAIETLDQVIEREPRHVEALLRRGVFLGLLGETRAALDDCRSALAINPGYREVHSNLLIRMQYDSEASPEAISDAHRAWSDRHGSAAPRPASQFANTRDPGRPLTIGWMSPRFDSGLITRFLTAPLQALPRPGFRHVFYNTRAGAESIPVELTGLGDWRLADGLDDSALAALVASDGVDILIDLAGHNPGNRLPALSSRLAPVQVSWLDYFCTTGVPAVDYWLTDDFLSPPGSQRLFSESLVRLPTTRLCYSPGDVAVPVGRSDRRPGEVVFGSFNRPGKLSEPVLASWAEILRALPGARLVLKAEEYGDQRVRERVLERLRRAGVDEGRVELRPPSPYLLMLAEYADIDIALDPFPFTGCATTCDALWMGVPVITLAGETTVGRQGCSILSNVGHREWIAADLGQYIERARSLAQDIGQKGFDRRALRSAMARSALCDTEAQAGALARFFRRAWSDFCAGKPPTGFELTGS